MTNPSSASQKVGVWLALLAALLFGCSTPLSKLLLNQMSPYLLASLLYLGAGIGLCTIFLLRRLNQRQSNESTLKRADLPWLLGAVTVGGVIGSLLLLTGLARTPASTSSLLLNLEGVFTALLAWFVFGENFDRRIAFGMLFILAGSVALSWQGEVNAESLLGVGLIVSACLCWALDNNLLQKVSASDPFQIAGMKGLVTGGVNLGIAISTGASLPPLPVLLSSLFLGFISYGVSLALFVLALRQIGTSRTGAYFALAPFVGAILSVLVLGESMSTGLLIAAILMGIGIWLHLSEQHGHTHGHPLLAHEHGHTHDAHHTHKHETDLDPGATHAYAHQHETNEHEHDHFPDIHHRHGH